MCTSQSRAHICCARLALSWAVECLCRVQHSVSFVRGRAPMLRALCLIVTSLPLEQCLFPVATQMDSVATWDLLTMTELCRDLKFSCCGLVSTTYTSLCRDTKKSCCNIRLLASFTLYHDTEELYRDMGFSFMPVLYRNLKAYAVTKKSPHQGNPYRDTKSHVATLNLLLPSIPVVT